MVVAWLSIPPDHTTVVCAYPAALSFAAAEMAAFEPPVQPLLVSKYHGRTRINGHVRALFQSYPPARIASNNKTRSHTHHLHPTVTMEFDYIRDALEMPTMSWPTIPLTMYSVVLAPVAGALVYKLLL